MNERDRKQAIRKLHAGLIIALVILGGIAAAAPVLGPGSSAFTERYTQSPPTTCIASATPPTEASRGVGNVTGTVHSLKDGIIEIRYTGTPTNNFSVITPQGLDIVATQGFQSREDEVVLGGPTGPTWDRTAATHWIRFRTSSSYPGGSSWQLAPIPRHARADVTLQPADEGYIGPHVLYIGPYTERSVTAGCQTITAIVPDQTVPWLNVDRRLADLRFAAESLRTGHTYEQVRVFVSPKELKSDEEAVFGYRLQDASTIIIHDYEPGNPASIAWLHEYVHTHQALREQPSAAWTQEGMATYLSIRLAVEAGRIQPRQYDAMLARGSGRSTTPLTTAPLGGEVTYNRGATLLARIETVTWQKNRTTSGELLRYLNQHRNPGQADIERFLRQSGDVPNRTVTEIHEQATTTRPVAPPYVLGPAWLPTWARTVLGRVATPHTAPLFITMAGILGLGAMLERTSYLERIERRIQERWR